MTHLSEEELLAYRNGEAAKPAAVEAHLRGCEACRSSYEALEQVLGLIESVPIPERGEEYGAQVWQKISGRLGRSEREGRKAWTGGWHWAAGFAFAAVVAIILASHLARLPKPQPQAPAATVATATDPAQARERILLDAVGNHLDRTQMMLLELANAAPSSEQGGDAAPAGSVNISREQAIAEELLASNRLYRLTAERLGDSRTTTALDALEPVLAQIAHSSEEVSPVELTQLHQRIAAGDVLFKVRVLSADVRQREIATARQAAFTLPEPRQEENSLP